MISSIVVTQMSSLFEGKKVVNAFVLNSVISVKFLYMVPRTWRKPFGLGLNELLDDIAEVV